MFSPGNLSHITNKCCYMYSPHARYLYMHPSFRKLATVLLKDNVTLSCDQLAHVMCSASE